MRSKTCAVMVKTTAADDSSLETGQFTALASVFNNIDEVGDVVMPGAFADNLKAWQESGDPIPVFWGHQMQDPSMNIGEVLEAVETETGLEVKAQLDLDNPVAMQVYRLLKGRRVSKMSFAYDVEDGAPAERDGRGVYELRKLKLHEVSVVQIPANPAAIIQEVKAAAERKAKEHDEPAPAGPTGEQTEDAVPDIKHTVRALSAKTESALCAALDRVAAGMADVKSALESLDNSNDGKANPPEPATAEEPSGAKTDSPAFRSGPASLRLRADLTELSAEVISLTD